jgi:hypothetical protein
MFPNVQLRPSHFLSKRHFCLYLLLLCTFFISSFRSFFFGFQCVLMFALRCVLKLNCYLVLLIAQFFIRNCSEMVQINSDNRNLEPKIAIIAGNSLNQKSEFSS